jgi:ketosteroid isomerase-like protein
VQIWFGFIAYLNLKAMRFRPEMMLFFLLLISCSTYVKDSPSKTANEAAIKEVLAQQVNAWNQGDINAFMQGYWKSDSLVFIGAKISNGWDSTLARYNRSYPDRAAMGTLRFEILRMDFISDDSYLVTGKYFLTREKDNPSGIFTLLFKKNNDQWLVVYDHTS